MYATIMIVGILLVTSPDVVFGRRRISLGDVSVCHYAKCGDVNNRFNCRCESSGWDEAEPECIPTTWLCDGQQDCTNSADELECSCPPGSFQCGGDRGGEVEHYEDQYNCIPIALVDDDNKDCFNGKDESGPSSLRCNGLIDYLDASDEKGCDGCPSDRPNRCACNQPGDEFSCRGYSRYTCYCDDWRCNGYLSCTDGSDEDGCSCRNGEFTCQCYLNQPQSCSSGTRGCIPMSKYRDERKDCEDGSDERTYLRKTNCGSCDVTIRRFDFVKQCENYSDCDNKTCIVVPALHCTDNAKCNATEVVCTSFCNTPSVSHSCNTIFQCENGYLEIAHNFCDGKIDCLDGSDEIIDQHGFKCSTSFRRCVLPQRNLHDDVPQCNDASDLCLKRSCFECIDGKLNISQTQLCDGVIDCFDLSDECLCQAHFHKPVCENIFVLDDPSNLCGQLNPQCKNNKATSIETAQCYNQYTFNRSMSSNETRFSQMPLYITCQTKLGVIIATMCDGRPECRNLEDECSCDNPPSFCNSSCHNHHAIGDRYCDGVNDKAWKFINDSSCPEGFDEKSCPQRFSCKARNLVSIDRVLVCDGIENYDDGSDENSCSSNFRFSSDSDMIESVALRSIFWVMTVLVVVGNIFVIVSTTSFLYQNKMSESQKFNNILILNLSFSDLLMGFYLCAISMKRVQYSGYYGEVDSQWRSSLECSIIGSLAVISSETSCFIMTIITAFRLYNVFNPFTARTASTLKWKLGVVLAWSISVILALVPVFKATSSYFVHGIWLSTQFTSGEDWNKTDVMTLACRLAILSNHSIEEKGDAWESTQVFLKTYFSEYAPKGEFGYYGETSVCMPRIYVHHGDHAWMFSLVIITFNFVSFLFVGISYILFYCKASNRPLKTTTSDKQKRKMQKRITRLIATDFACWVPICIMVYIKTGGVQISNVVYLVTAGLLLPINSALNPFLYSPIIEKYFLQVFCKKKRNVPQQVVIRNLN